MGRWVIVFFYKDNSIEAVPDSWVAKNHCAWPKLSKNVKHYIKNRSKPNKIDFVYYPARILGNKNYATLAEAQAKLTKAAQGSDLSTTEDEANKFKKRKLKHVKHVNSAINNSKITATQAPPSYTEFCSKDSIVTNSQNNTESLNKSCHSSFKGYNSDIHFNQTTIDDHNDSVTDPVTDDNDNSDTDPTWGQKCLNFESDSADDKSSENNDNTETLPVESYVQVQNVNDQEKADLALHIESAFKSPPGKWTVSTTNTVSEESVKLSKVKKTLFLDESTNTMKGSPSKEKPKLFNKSATYNTDKFMVPKEFQKFVFTSLTHMKYDMSAMMHIINETNENVKALIACSNKNRGPTTTLSHSYVDDMNIFPLTNEDQLKMVEDQIEDTDFRNELVFKMSLLVDNSNLNTSVRRIITRLCDDTLLLNYSLTGFKHNKAFSNLKIYRVIIDAIRTNMQFTKVPDQKIDTPLRVWLDHSKFRIQNKNEKRSKTVV